MKKSSFVEGTVIATVAIFLVKILGMLYVIPFYATVGSQGSALYGYGYNIYLIFLGISSAGVPVAMSKIINEFSTLGLNEAKIRAFKLGRKIISYFSIAIFFFLFVFAEHIALFIIGDLTGGNTINDVAFIVRCVSFAILIVPFLSISKGFLQGHKYIAPSSTSQIIEQVVRVFIIVVGSFIAINVFNSTVTVAVGVAMLGAFFSGLVAYAYIHHKIQKHKKQLSLDKKLKKDKITDKEIVKKLISYSIPFIIINLTMNLYNFLDMVLILRTLNYLKMPATDVEFITSAISTWGPKLNMIIVALAQGMSLSLIPNIVESFVLKDWKDVELKINKALQIILIVSIPGVIGISFLAEPIWTIFYGTSTYGPIIFRYSIFTALFANIYMISTSTLQGLNKFKSVYICAIGGFGLTAILDIPMMLLFDKLSLYPFYGAITATIIGYSVSIFIGLKTINKDCKISYKDTLNKLLRILVPVLSMIVALLTLKIFLPFDNLTRGTSLLYTVIYSAVGASIYLSIAYKMGLIKEIFGVAYLNKIIKKLTLGKVSIKN